MRRAGRPYQSGAVATDTVVNTGAEGGPDAENGDTGQTVYGDAVRTTIQKNGRQIVAAEGTDTLWFTPAATRLYMVTHWIPR